jgi:hypothetical protein
LRVRGLAELGGIRTEALFLFGETLEGDPLGFDAQNGDLWVFEPYHGSMPRLRSGFADLFVATVDDRIVNTTPKRPWFESLVDRCRVWLVGELGPSARDICSSPLLEPVFAAGEELDIGPLLPDEDRVAFALPSLEGTISVQRNSSDLRASICIEFDVDRASLADRLTALLVDLGCRVTGWTKGKSLNA